MDYIYGQLQKQIEKVEYDPIDTKSATTTIDQGKRTIQVDVNLDDNSPVASKDFVKETVSGGITQVIVQETGTDTDKVMSQDAVTKELDAKQDTITKDTALDIRTISVSSTGSFIGIGTNFLSVGNLLQGPGFVSSKDVFEIYNDIFTTGVETINLYCTGFLDLHGQIVNIGGTSGVTFESSVYFNDDLYLNDSGYAIRKPTASSVDIFLPDSTGTLALQSEIPTDYLPVKKDGSVAITKDLTIGGNLTVNGTTTTVDTNTLKVKDKLIYVAEDNTVALTTPAGIITPKYNGKDTGGILYDANGVAYVGDVVIDASGNVDVAASDLQPIATRSATIDNQHIVMWDSAKLQFVDADTTVDDITTAIAGKQDKLTEGSNISIYTTAGKTVINATDTKYSAGTNIEITGTTIRTKSYLAVTGVYGSDGQLRLQGVSDHGAGILIESSGISLTSSLTYINGAALNIGASTNISGNLTTTGFAKIHQADGSSGAPLQVYSNNGDFIEAYKGSSYTQIDMQDGSYDNTVYLPTGNGTIALISDFTNGIYFTSNTAPILWSNGGSDDTTLIPQKGFSQPVEIKLPAKSGTLATLTDVKTYTSGDNIDISETGVISTISGPSFANLTVDNAIEFKTAYGEPQLKYGTTEFVIPQMSGTHTIATTDQIPAITQTTGSNTGTVMSQKAVTDELSKKINMEGGLVAGDGIDIINPCGSFLVISATQTGGGLPQTPSGPYATLVASGQVGATPTWKDIREEAIEANYLLQDHSQGFVSYNAHTTGAIFEKYVDAADETGITGISKFVLMSPTLPTNEFETKTLLLPFANGTLAIRADSSLFTEGHLVKFDKTENKLVDAGKSTDDFVPSTSTPWRVYITDGNGAQALRQLVTTPVASGMPQYTSDGILKTNTPKVDLDCANKGYVDTSTAVLIDDSLLGG